MLFHLQGNNIQFKVLIEIVLWLKNLLLANLNNPLLKLETREPRLSFSFY